MPSSDDDQLPEFGQRVRTRREQLGLNQTELGLLAGVHRSTIRAIEMGNRVENRTTLSVLYSLGCTTGAQPLLSTRLAQAIAHAILAVRDQEEAIGIVADYEELMHAVADALGGPVRRIPKNFVRFRDALPLTGPQRRILDNELALAFGSIYPYRRTNAATDRGHASHAHAAKIAKLHPSPAHSPEIADILGSRLPEMVKAELIEYAISRRNQLTVQLAEEVQRLIAGIVAGVESSTGIVEEHEEIDHGHGEEDS